MKADKKRRTARPLALLGLGLTMAMAWWAVLTVLAHNVDQRMNWMFYDPDTLDAFSVRAGAGEDLIQVGDEIGIILKATPEPSGATTGVGGYIDFYIPLGTQVVDVGYALPDGSGGFSMIPMKGQSIMPIGDGPVGAKVTSQLVGLTLGPNITGQTEAPVTTAGLHRGTLAGVYADTGIFYATDPSTAWQSWADHPAGNFSITNNRGEIVFPNNKWDAEQLLAYGSRSPAVPIVDPDGRGSTPWGLGSGVAGPLSGYAWEFDWDVWRTSAKTAADMRNAADGVGPWQRIAYAGSQVSKDQAGLRSSTLGFAGQDAGTLGTVVTPASPLPPTVSTTDTTSPKVIRWSVGQLSFGRPEYVFVKIRVNDLTAQDPDGCFLAHADVFGGDAGGEQGGKDHLWRYYDPTTTTLNACAAIRKKSSKDVVANGEIFQYTIEFWNTSPSLTLTNVKIRDFLPGSVSFISANPLQNSGPNPLLWTIPSIAPGQKVEFTVTVKALSSGVLALNNVTFETDEDVDGGNDEGVFLGQNPVLVVSKSVTPTTTSPGGSVQYTLLTRNIGAGPSGNPVTVDDYLPAGFTYTSLQSVTINGVNGLGLTAVNSSNPNHPVFTVSQAIQKDQSLQIVFNAQVGASVLAGSYCNQFSATHRDPVLGDDATINTGSEACVQVGGGALGDTIYRDWNGNGVQEGDEEGIPGVTVELRNGACTPSVNCPTQVTGAAGAYSFIGLTAGTYTVAVIAGIPAGYSATGDPDEVGACSTCDQLSTVTLAANEERFDLDFGYQPGGSGSIGDLIFEDIGNDGAHNGSDPGIDGITVALYEDSNGNGTLDGQDSLVASQVTAGGGAYSFSGLAEGLDYLVVVDESQPQLVSYFSPDAFQASTLSPHPVTSLSGSYTAADIGFFRITPSSIGDQVFLDADRDGLFDAVEDPVPMVLVRLYRDDNGDGIGDVLLKTTTTNASGMYLFANLGPADYVVEIDENDTDIPAGWVPSVNDIAVSLGVSQDVTSVDFPLIQILQKSVDKEFAAVGETITYSLAANHPGSGQLQNVVVSDDIPAGTTYVASSANAGGTHDGGSPGTVSWNLGDTIPGVPAVVAGTAACPAEVTLTTADAGGKDTFLQAGAASGQNFGTATQLKSKLSDKRILLYFPVNLPAGSSVTQATLEVTADADNRTRTAHVFDLNTAWTEGVSNNPCTVGATWDAPNCTDNWAGGASFSAADYVTVASPPILAGSNTGLTDTTDVTNIVSNWVSGTNKGLVIIDQSNSDVKIRSNNTVDPPRLLIRYLTPTPGGCSDVTNLNPSADTYVREDASTRNYGARDRIETNPANNSSGINERHGLLRYSLISIPPGATINSATLTLTSSTIRSNHTVEVRRATRSWTEGTGSDVNCVTGASWDAPNCTDTSTGWNGSGGNFSTGPWGSTVYGTAIPDTTPYDIDVTALVQAWVDGDFINQGIVMRGTGTDTGQANWGSNESASPATLVVDWVLVADTGRTSTMTAAGTLATHGQAVTVGIELTADSAVADVTPGTIQVNGSAAGASCGAPVLTSADDDIGGPGDPVNYEWTCTVSAGSLPEDITFQATASGNLGSTTWPAAVSNSVIVTPVLTFQVTVNALPGVTSIDNQGEIQASAIPLTLSNIVVTNLTPSIGDRVWDDLDGDGVQDVGEPGASGITVELFTDPNGDGDPSDGVSQGTRISDASGLYLFKNLTAGNYVAVLDLSSLPTDYHPTTPTSVAHALGASEQFRAADFGIRPPGDSSIGDTVWIDSNEDGVVDPDEDPLPNITLNLYLDRGTIGSLDAADILIASEDTDSNGNYLFAGLNNETYLVVVDETSSVDIPSGGSTTLATAMNLVSGSNPLAVSLGAAENLTSADFGYKWAGSIGDFVWYDDDGDTVQDAGEEGAPDVTILLYEDSNSNGSKDFGEPVLDSTVTDANGFYEFDNLPPGFYVVDVDESTVPSPSSGALDSMIPTTGDKHAVNLAAAEAYTDADFGFIEASIIGDAVFHDVDHNGVFDPGEPGISGVSISLSGFDIAGNPVSRMAVSDGSGAYAIIVPPGTYTISYSPGDPAIPANLTDPTTPTSYLVAVVGGQVFLDADFGLDDAGSIGDLIFSDVNGDGVKGAGEPGLPGVTVVLYSDPNGDGDRSDGAQLATQASDGFGGYLFEGLPAGSYVVEVDASTLPAGVTQTADPDEAGTCSICDDDGVSTIAAGGSDLSLDFGYQTPVTVHTVSGRVWDDNGAGGGTAADGIQNGSEPGIANVTITVQVDTDNDMVVDQTFVTTSDGNGDWSVDGIEDGSDVRVLVDETDLPSTSYVQTGDPDATLDSETSLTNVVADVSGLDFGYQEQFGSISGTVCAGSGDGLCDDPGETPGLANVFIILRYAGSDGFLGTSDDVLSSTTTNASGDYSFSGLLAGLYQVSEVNPATYVSLADADAGNPDNISVNLAAGEDLADRDFEDSPLDLGAIGDRVWLDTDRDGVQDVGEPGLSNVMVQLWDAGTDMMVGGVDDVLQGTRVTSSDGTYLFAGLAGGTYFVDVVNATVPAGLSLTLAVDPTAPITITRTESYLDADFGYNGTDPDLGVVGDYVWSDADADGLQDAGEAGLSGVVVNLRDAATGTLVAQTQTSAGFYLFTGVAPGEYVVEIDSSNFSGLGVLVGYTATSGPQSEGNETSDPFQIIPGSTRTDLDFGYQNAATFSISDRVWFDADADTSQDAAEGGIPGVTVNLYQDDGDGVLEPGTDDLIIATDTSDANGDVDFSGLASGGYFLFVSDTANRLITLSGTTVAAQAGELLVNVSGADESGINFGYNIPGVIGDTVFSDADGDGVQDPGEPGIAGLTVLLYLDSDGDGVFNSALDLLVGTTQTDDTGHYLFEGLSIGTYFASVDDSQAALTGYTPTTADSQAGESGTQLDATLSGPQAGFLDADFGYQNSLLADISGNVFNDLDIDGVDDGAAEPGIGGVTLELRIAGPDLLLGTSDDLVLSTTLTDSAGDYSFDDLPAGNYLVAVTDEAGVLDSFRLTSGLDQIPVSLAAADITGVDFGYARDPGTGIIGDRVWFDRDADGVEDADDSGIVGVTLFLYDSGPDLQVGGGDDTLLDTAVTAAGGYYAFGQVTPGLYYVSVDGGSLPAGLVLSGGTDPSALINLSEGETYLLADFGYTSVAGKGVVGDTVFYDADSDGRQDPEEVGIGGVRVWLDLNGNNVFDLGIDVETTTSADGKYLFTNLDPGLIGARVDTSTLPAGFNTTTTTPPLARDFMLASGATILTVDWGFNAPAGVTASLGDTVFLDVNGNGSQDAGDSGIAGVTVELRDGSNQLVAGTTTDNSGTYSFIGLVAGSYTVIVTDRGAILGNLNPSADPDEAGTCSVCDERGSTTLAAGATDNSLDFGYAPSAGSGSIGDAVWHDLDGDGVYEPNGNDGVAGTFDDEPGFGGVTLSLWVDSNNNGSIDGGDNLIRTTTTDENGFYVFNGVIAGDYLVTITDKFGVLDTNGDGNLSEWTLTARSDPADSTLSSGTPTDLTVDFGFLAVAPLSLAGITYHDANDNQIFEMGESVISEVTVYLHRDLDGDGILDPGEPRMGRVRTNGSGAYLFSNLPPGDYIVSVDPLGSLAAGMSQTTQQASSGVEAVSLLASDITDVDFGFNIVATLAVIEDFRVYLDKDKNAIVQWRTISEIGTVGFHLERAVGGAYERLNSELLPALVDTPQGGTYRFLDPAVSKNEKHTYRLVELEADGNLRRYGPFEVKVHGSGPELSTPPYERVANPAGDDPHKIADGKARREEEKGRKEDEKKVKFKGQISLRILTRDRGMHFISAEEVAQASGASVKDVAKAIDKGDVKLTNQGNQVSYLSLEGGEGFYFFAEALDSNYAAFNVYWLTPEKGTRMASLKAKKPKKVEALSQARVMEHYEEDRSPVPFLTFDPESDYWHWNYLRAGYAGESVRNYTLSTPAALASGPAEIRVYMKGATNLAAGNDHSVRVFLNGVEIGSAQWDGLQVKVLTAGFDQSLLNDGDNQVQLVSSLQPGVAYSVVWVDSFEIDYTRRLQTSRDSLEFSAGAGEIITTAGFSADAIGIFELSNPLSPRYVSESRVQEDGGTYQVAFESAGAGSHYLLLGPRAIHSAVALELNSPSDLTKKNNKAEYLVLTPLELSDGAQALADFRSGQYLTQMVLLQDIYDEFNWGIASPYAVREFLRYAYEKWKVAPELVVFAGKGSYDYKDIFGLGTNVFPPAMATTPWGLFASDTRLLDFNDDGVPEIAGGRIPALSSQDLFDYVEKLERQQFQVAGAGSRLLLLADDPDPGGNFPLDSDYVAQGAAPEVDLLKLYHQTGTAGLATHQALMAALEEGVDYVNYLGHGAVIQLGQENFLNSSHVATLRNGRLPILAALTCTAGNGSYPGLSSLLEELLNHPQGGIIAGIGSSSLSLNPQAVQLNRILMEGLYGINPEHNLGVSFKHALEALRDAGGFRFVLESYSITGDPAVRPQ